LTTLLESLEKTVRQQVLEHVTPEIGVFYQDAHRHNRRAHSTPEKLSGRATHHQRASRKASRKAPHPVKSLPREMLPADHRQEFTRPTAASVVEELSLDEASAYLPTR